MKIKSIHTIKAPSQVRRLHEDKDAEEELNIKQTKIR